MKSIFSTIMNNSLFNFAKRLAIVCVFLSISAAAAAGSNYTARYYIDNVQLASGATGSGTVYFTATGGTVYDDNREGYHPSGSLSPDNTTIKFHVYQTTDNDNATTFTGSLLADAAPGSIFEGWDISQYTTTPTTGATYTQEIKTTNSSGDTYFFKLSIDSRSSDYHWRNESPLYARFTAKTYRRRTPALKMAIYVPAVEGVSEEQWLETAETSIGQVRINNGEWQSSVDFGIASQRGNGIDDNAYVSYTIEAEAKTRYAFRGWFIHNDDGTYTELSMNPSYLSTEYSAQSVEDNEDPYVHTGLDDQTIYAHFIDDRDYYHKRAKVGIASNSEIGKVYVSAEEINDITEWQSPANDELFVSNEADGTTGSTTSDVVAERNALRYDYFFYARPQDPEKVAFKGWTTNADGSNITQTDNPYQAIFTASENPNTAHEPTTMYAVFRSYYYAKPHIIAIGGGKVSLDNNENTAQTEIDDISSPEQKPAIGEYHEYTYTLYAHEETGSRFMGWSKSSSEMDILEADREVLSKVITGRTSSMSSVQPHRVTWYAIFKSEIDIKHADRMIYYKDNQDNEYINDAKLIVDVYNAKTLDVQLEGPNAHLFQVMDATLVKKGDHLTVEADQGYIELSLKYIGGAPLSDAIGKTVSVKFTSKDSESKVLATNTHTCIVENAPVITFLPTDGRGSYTISHTDGSGIIYTLAEDAENSQRIVVTHENMSYLKIEMTDNSSDDRDFFGWEIVEDGHPTGEYLSYEKLFTYHFEKSVTLRAEFVPQGWARYVIKSDYTVNKSNPTLYYDLNDAIEQAKKGSSADEKTIVVHRSGLLPKGNYDIPAGVILLVPYEDTYICTTGQKPEEGYQWIDPLYDANGVPQNPLPDLEIFRKLTVESGTNITVEDQGAICVEAKLLIYAQTCIAQPFIAGHLELGDGSLIDMKDGSSLFAWGYITNPENTKVDIHTMKHVGRVNAESGATVWEVLQFNDFRGGSAMMSFVKLSGFGAIVGAVTADPCGYMYEVFPINQYYVKNVEVPLHLSYGASEMLVTGVYAGDVYSVTSVPFVGSNSGLMTWGTSSATTITKFYDAYKDRQIYVVEDNQNIRASMKFGDVALSLNIIGQTVDIHSRDYVMPLTNNMDVIVRNAHIEIPSGINLCLLAGSSIHLDRNSIGTNYSQIFIYDKDQNTFTDGSGYYGSTDSPLLPIYPNHRPYGRKFDRTTGNLSDARLIVDGQLNCNNGYLITTSSGANITSNGGGRIQLSRFGQSSTGTASGWSPTFNRNQSIFQYDQSASKYIAIPLAERGGSFYPKLQHADGDYLDATSAKTYYYCNGSWQVGACSGDNGYQEPYVDYTPLFSIADPWSCDAWVGEGAKSFDLTISEENTTNVQSISRSYSADFSGRDASLFSFDSTTKKITFNPASAGTKTAVMILTATYTHPTTSVKYVYSLAVDLTATAREQIANTLAFANVDALYIGQSPTALLVNGNNTNKVQITVSKDGVVTTNNDVLWSQATIHADAEGEVIITVTQAADNTNHIAGITLTKKVKVTEPVVWNWETLYYPSINTNPITIMDGSTEDWTLTEVIDKESGDVVQFRGNGSVGGAPDTYEAEIYDLINGKYKVHFEFKRGAETKKFTSEIFYDPRELRVDVNSDTVYNGITVGAAEGIEFNKNRKTVTIVSTPQQANAWTIHFLGIPDKLYFEPVDSPNAWQIEESTNGKTWTTTMPWAYLTQNQPFEYSLMPTTQYVRISYGANGDGVMRDVYITKLEGVKFSPEKVYMPVEIDGNDQLITHSREVAITYVSSRDVSVTSATAGEFTFNKSSFGATTSNPFYKVEKLVITNATCREEKLTGVNVTSSIGTEVIPVQTFFYPQELPIVLASDMPAERYHYVTTQSYRTTWDEETRTIYMDNAVANAEPFVVFHYDGAPSYISFNHNADANAEWIIEESTDGINWTTASDTLETSATSIKQYVKPTTTYIRVAYSSLHAKQVAITNLMIIGEEGAFVDPTELTVEYIADNNRSKGFTVTAINLTSGMIVSTDNTNFTLTQGTSAEQQTITIASGQDGLKEMAFKVYFNGSSAVDYTTITVTNNPAAGEEKKVLAMIQVTGIRKTLINGDINMYTGVPDGTYDNEGNKLSEDGAYTLSDFAEGKAYRKLDISHAFAGEKAIFDYLFIFDETTTTDAITTISRPTTIVGSNAKTPCYIYKKNGDAYEFHTLVENANAGTKITQDFLRLTDPAAETLKVYITGFCPYASTGYTKQDEGVFFFRGGAGDNVHVYLQDCYIFSRSKTEDGHYFEGRSDGQAFTDNYVQGSGGVLVFECSDKANANGQAFNVTIHTRDSSMFKSHYGCFLESVAGRAYQVSAPVQVHMQSSDFVTGSYTVLNFDDIWPTASATDANGVFTTIERTNGFLSLQKQVNNAPSIDLGNANTVVNFNGGQVELQNACNSSDNYNSTLAISYRGGRFAGFLLAYGLGSDEVTGTVNFNDGTTTVLTMDVPERYRQYYLMDENGTSTSCLRTPKNTYVFGGSHCMMRACEAATSKGGAPTRNGNPLGLYKYPKIKPVVEAGQTAPRGGFGEPNGVGLVEPTDIPTSYQAESVSPNTNGTDDTRDDYLNFWFTTEEESSVEPEKDQTISFWRACMTEIGASYGGYGDVVGGDVEISFKNGNQEELVSNLLYCKIDESIQRVITQPSYQAPVKSPMPQGEPYLYVTPTTVGDKMQHYVTNAKPYQIENKVYYITTATADVWQTFTAPFDVENIYVMEAYPEAKLEEYASEVPAGTNVRDAVMTLQARYNAHFASFFGVAMCIHPNKTFDMIYSDFNTWARQEYASTDFGKQPIIPFNGSNWSDANAYIFHNNTESNWELGWDAEENPTYTPNWERVEGQTGGAIMHQGETYSMLFPYCIGCWEKDGDGNVKDRTYWDYWSGKFIIFESTDGPHQINGTDFIAATDVNSTKAGDWVLEDMTPSATKAILTGNSTLAKMTTTNGNIFYYDAAPGEEYFYPTYERETPVEPTTAFLFATPPTEPTTGMPAKAIGRSGKVIYDKENTPTGNIPTVGGGKDLFITATVAGINIAVAEPQHVRVMSATGAIIYSGMVQTAVDVALPATGVYVITGENEVHKILH